MSPSVVKATLVFHLSVAVSGEEVVVTCYMHVATNETARKGTVDTHFHMRNEQVNLESLERSVEQTGICNSTGSVEQTDIYNSTGSDE
jgi:hypothetical protein